MRETRRLTRRAVVEFKRRHTRQTAFYGRLTSFLLNKRIEVCNLHNKCYGAFGCELNMFWILRENNKL